MAKIVEFVGKGKPATPEEIARITAAGATAPEGPKMECLGDYADAEGNIDVSKAKAPWDYTTEEGQAEFLKVMPKALGIMDFHKKDFTVTVKAYFGMTANLVKMAHNVRRLLDARPDDKDLAILLNGINIEIEQFLLYAITQATEAVAENGVK